MENEKKDEVLAESIIEALKKALSEFLDSGCPVGNFNLKIAHVNKDNIPVHLYELGIIFMRYGGSHEMCKKIAQTLSDYAEKEMEKDHEDQQNLH